MRVGTILLALVSAVTLLLVPALATAGQTPTPQLVGEVGAPTYKVDGSAVSRRSGRTIPTWTSSFSFQGTSYPFTMVGSAPQAGGTTSVPAVVVPLRIAFADGTVFDASTRTASVAGSPLFTPASFTSGLTQYGDAIQRAELWSVGGSGDYHVLLGGPAVLPAQTINVPQAKGSVVRNSRGVIVGRIDDFWLSDRIHNLLVSLAFDPATLPIFLADQVVTYDHDPSNCCGIGFHGASASSNGNGNQKVLTWVFAAYIAPGTFSVDGIADVAPLSHEVAEWLNDPFLSNVTPTWSAPGYGCQNLLETGDPLVGTSFTLGGYHLQDEAFLSWFARQAPSIAQDGRYSYLGTFTAPSTGC